MIPHPFILPVVWFRQHLTHLCGHSWLLPEPIRLCGVGSHPAVQAALSRVLVKTTKQILWIRFWEVSKHLFFWFSLLISRRCLKETWHDTIYNHPRLVVLTAESAGRELMWMVWALRQSHACCLRLGFYMRIWSHASFKQSDGDMKMI